MKNKFLNAHENIFHVCKINYKIQNYPMKDVLVYIYKLNTGGSNKKSCMYLGVPLPSISLTCQSKE